jgi:aminocarboxymuconate-semialdehyde decarboxylase
MNAKHDSAKAGKQGTIHRCEPASARAVTPGTKVERPPHTTIDVHCHLLTASIEPLVAGQPAKVAEAEGFASAMGQASASVNANMFSVLLPKLTRIGERLHDMDAMGIDVQAVSPSPTQYYYWAPPDLAEIIVDRQNDEVASLCESHCDRFLGLGTVAMQYPATAATQLEILVRERKFKGVQISSLVNGLDISDRFFDPFWRKADELGAVVFIHPWGTTVGARFAESYLMNTIGQPLETTVALSKLILGGTLDRHPELKIIAAHGGGYLPLYGERMDHARAMRPDAGCCVYRPTEYLRRIWYDSIVYDSRHLEQLIQVVGASQVVIGTDYPFDMGHYDPAALLRELNPTIQSAILGGNASRLFGLDSEERRND